MAAGRGGPPQCAAPVRPLVLLLKGHPGAGKSTLATALAAALGGAALLDKDDHRTMDAGASASDLNEAAYAATAAALAASLAAGARVVIVDTPLSTRARWDAFERATKGGAALVLVEVSCSNAALSRTRLEARAAAAPPADAHKPTTWGELQALVAAYGGSDAWPAAAARAPPWALRLSLDTARAPPAALAAAAAASLRGAGLAGGAGPG